MITGATGFAGSFLAQRYWQEGWEVHGTYRDVLPDPTWFAPDMTFHRVDLLQADAVSQLVDSLRPRVVQHLAAQSSVSQSWKDPMGTLEQNVRMQFHMLEAVRHACPTARVVVVGSCDEYGAVPVEKNPIVETDPLLPANPYALSKVVQDLMGVQYVEVYGMDIVRVRPFLQIGPRRSAQFVTGSVARQIAEISLGVREPVIEVGNIELKRDFTDVRDIVRAYVAVADRGMSGHVYNVASGHAHSLRDLISTMLQAGDVQAEVRVVSDRIRRNEAPLLMGDTSKLRSATGWAPEISFEQSAADTVDDWRQQIRQALMTEGDKR